MKLDEMRPDLIVLDDIDDTSDSQETIAKKIVAITQKLLPAGSTDAATLAVQNLVRYDGVFARLANVADEAADFLADRIVSGPHPALIGAEFEKQPDGRWLIIRGTPTWDGQNVEICQQQLNDIGIRAFRSEMQHEKALPANAAFPEWDASVHVCDPFPIPERWPRWRSVDYGYGVPYCCLWFTQSPSGRIYIYRETYGAGKTALEQAYEVRLNSVDEHFAFTVADPSMWASEREGEKFKSHADQYAEIGIPLQPASNNRIAGWDRLHDVLEWAEEAPPVLQVFRTCHNFIRTFPMLPRHPHKPDDVDSLDPSLEDHAGDAGRYGLMAAHWLAATARREPQSYSMGRR